jgi:aspartate-semialdehyde dehydrogenase
VTSTPVDLIKATAGLIGAQLRMRPCPGGNDCLVGRIRTDPPVRDGRRLTFCVSGHNLRSGTAFNAVRIAQELVGSKHLGACPGN